MMLLTANSRQRVYQFRHERGKLNLRYTAGSQEMFWIRGPGRTRTDGDLRRRIKNPLP